MASLLEVVQEGLAHFGGSPLRLFVRHGCGLRACEEACRSGEARRACVWESGQTVRGAAGAGLESSASQGSLNVTQIHSSQSCVHVELPNCGTPLQVPRDEWKRDNASSRIAQKCACQHKHRAQQLPGGCSVHKSPTCDDCLPLAGNGRTHKIILCNRKSGCDGWRQSSLPTA